MANIINDITLKDYMDAIKLNEELIAKGWTKKRESKLPDIIEKFRYPLQHNKMKQL